MKIGVTSVTVRRGMPPVCPQAEVRGGAGVAGVDWAEVEAEHVTAGDWRMELCSLQSHNSHPHPNISHCS